MPVAEIAGLALALKIARNNGWLSLPPVPPATCSVEIWMDNQSALNALQCPKMGPGQYILQEAIMLLQGCPRGTVSFHWILAYLDVPGNELADEHAKRANWRTMRALVENICIEHSYLYLILQRLLATLTYRRTGIKQSIMELSLYFKGGSINYLQNREK